MKKQLLFALLALQAVTLVSCKNEVKFVEGIKVEEQVVDTDRSILIANVADKLLNVSGVKCQDREYHYSEIEEETKEINRTIEYYDLGMKDIVKTDTTTKSSGIEWTSSDEKTTVVYVSDNEKIKYVNSKEEPSVSRIVINDAYLVKQQLYMEFYNSTVEALETSPSYKVGKGYTFVTQSYDYSVTPAICDNKTKENKTTEKYQRVIEVNSDYQITKYTILEEKISTRDLKTNAWYETDKVVEKNSSSVEFVYGQKHTFDDSNLNDLKHSFIEDANLELSIGNLNKMSDETYVEHLSLTHIRMSCHYDLSNLVNNQVYVLGTKFYGKYSTDYRLESCLYITPIDLLSFEPATDEGTYYYNHNEKNKGMTIYIDFMLDENEQPRHYVSYEFD